MINHWAEHYLGSPWCKGGQTPHAFNCWELARQVLREHYQIVVPEVLVDTGDLRACVKTFNGHRESGLWHLVADPQAGDCVLMSQGKEPTHIGVWIDADGGGVLHSVKKTGVIFSKAAHLSHLGYNVLGKYRYAR